MAITSITVANTDHFAKGGIKQIQIAAPDTSSAATDAGDGSVTSFQIAGSGVATFDFEKETAKMTVSATQEKGLMLYTTSIEFYVPKMDAAKLKAVQNLVGVQALADVTTYDGARYMVGYDFILKNSDLGADTEPTDFGLVLESVEADTGAALADQNGFTLKLTAVTAHPPYVIAS